MRQYISLAIFSASSLALEVTLTRLLSTLYYPPFIFVVLSLAIFGIAIGAAWVVIEEFLRDEKRIPLWIAASSVAVIIQVVGLPFSATLDSPILTGLLLVLPYVAIGVTLACIFSALSTQSQTLYAYDLVGAGLGALLVIPLLNFLNPLNAMLLIASIMLLTAYLYRANKVVAVLIPIALVLFIGNSMTNFIALDLTNLSAEKPIQTTLREGGEIIDTRWNAFARTDLVVPAGNQPWRLYVDGAAASVIPPAENNNFLLQDIGLFAFATAQPDNVFIIGSGGGLDVWFGLQVGASNITAVEVNPESVAIVQDIQPYSGDIYDNPAVRVLVDEGRSALRREDELYDLIYLSQVVTLSAERTGYALTENAVFTVEAFDDYWQHLDDDGYLALKLYDEPTLSRSLSIIINLLNQQGIDDREALHHTITLLSPTTTPPTPMLIVRKTPFTEEEALSIGTAAQQLDFVSLYLPFIQADPPLDMIASGESTFDDIIAVSNLDLSAPTDNRPFFYQFEKGIPRNLNPLLIASAVVLIILVLGLGFFARQSTEATPKLLIMSLYFAGLGAGFILIELVLIQATGLFIGHPTLAITTTLAVLLMGGGLGSAWYHRRNPNPQQMQWSVLAILAVLIAVWQFLWIPLSDALIGMLTLVRLSIVGVSIFPIGFMMGIPFAVGLRIVEQLHPHYVAIAWAINGTFTVLGTVLGVVLALLFGYNIVMLVGIISYMLVLIVSRQLHLRGIT